MTLPSLLHLSPQLKVLSNSFYNFSIQHMLPLPQKKIFIFNITIKALPSVKTLELKYS